MAAKLTGVIPAQNFEVLRDKIAAILALELENQYVLDNTQPRVKNVWLERFHAFDENTELPAVNVCFSQGSYSNQTRVRTQGAYTFVIDVYTNASATQSNTGGIQYGDKKAMLVMTKILGMIRTILSAPVYKTLEVSGVVAHSAVERMYIGDKSTAVDALMGVVGRIVYTISSIETTQLQDSVPLELSTVTVLLEESDEGFRIEVPTV